MNVSEMLRLAVATYAEISGMSIADVAFECLDINSQTAKNVILLIEAAK